MGFTATILYLSIIYIDHTPPLSLAFYIKENKYLNELFLRISILFCSHDKCCMLVFHILEEGEF